MTVSEAGVCKAQRIAPLTKSGRGQKVGAALGPLVPLGLILMAGIRLLRPARFTRCDTQSGLGRDVLRIARVVFISSIHPIHLPTSAQRRIANVISA